MCTKYKHHVLYTIRPATWEHIVSIINFSRIFILLVFTLCGLQLGKVFSYNKVYTTTLCVVHYKSIFFSGVYVISVVHNKNVEDV